MRDWRHDAEQYRDLDRAAQARAERELDAVMGALAESVADLPDAEVLAEAREAGEDTAVIAARVQDMIRAATTDAEQLIHETHVANHETIMAFRETRLIDLAPRMAEALRVIAADPGDMLPEPLVELRARVMAEVRAILRELDGGA